MKTSLRRQIYLILQRPGLGQGRTMGTGEGWSGIFLPCFSIMVQAVLPFICCIPNWFCVMKCCVWQRFVRFSLKYYSTVFNIWNAIVYRLHIPVGTEVRRRTQMKWLQIMDILLLLCCLQSWSFVQPVHKIYARVLHICFYMISLCLKPFSCAAGQKKRWRFVGYMAQKRVLGLSVVKWCKISWLWTTT